MSAPVLVITGGSRGIGEAVALRAARRGYFVVLTYVANADRASSVVERIRESGGKAIALQADTAEEADIKRVFIEADKHGTLAVLVYNSGVTGQHSALIDADTSTIDRVLDVNLRGAILCAREAARRMSTRIGGSGGAIVFVSSRAAFYGSPSGVRLVCRIERGHGQPYKWTGSRTGCGRRPGKCRVTRSHRNGNASTRQT